MDCFFLIISITYIHTLSFGGIVIKLFYRNEQ